MTEYERDLLDQCDAASKNLAENYRRLGLRYFGVRDQDKDALYVTIIGPIEQTTPDVMRKAASTCETYLRRQAN